MLPAHSAIALLVHGVIISLIAPYQYARGSFEQIQLLGGIKRNHASQIEAWSRLQNDRIPPPYAPRRQQRDAGRSRKKAAGSAPAALLLDFQ